MNPTPKLTHADRRARRARIVNAMRAGDTAECVAQNEGVSIRLVCMYARQAGVQPLRANTHGGRMNANTYEIIAALMQHSVAGEIAAKFGVSKQRVSQIQAKARKAGILPG